MNIEGQPDQQKNIVPGNKPDPGVSQKKVQDREKKLKQLTQKRRKVHNTILTELRIIRQKAHIGSKLYLVLSGFLIIAIFGTIGIGLFVAINALPFIQNVWIGILPTSFLGALVGLCAAAVYFHKLSQKLSDKADSITFKMGQLAILWSVRGRMSLLDYMTRVTELLESKAPTSHSSEDETS